MLRVYLGKVERRVPSPILCILPGPSPCVVDTDPCKDEDVGQALCSVVQYAGILLFMMLCEDVATTPSLYYRIIFHIFVQNLLTRQCQTHAALPQPARGYSYYVYMYAYIYVYMNLYLHLLVFVTTFCTVGVCTRSLSYRYSHDGSGGTRHHASASGKNPHTSASILHSEESQVATLSQEHPC